MKRFLTLAATLAFAPFCMASATTYEQFYISYISAPAATSISEYVKNKGLAGIIFWELRGDTPFTEKTSLLNAISTSLASYSPSGNKPFVMGYWSDWNVYSADPSTRAIPEPAYGVPGSLDTTGKPVTNTDFTTKLAGMSAIAYSFVEAQTQQFTYYDSASGQMVTIDNKTPGKIGTLYFNDPWADLNKPGVSKEQDALCAANKAICEFALTNRNQPIEFKNGVQMGNFNAFSALQSANNTLGPLRKLMSVGGYGHDATFEDAFNSPNGIDNFVNSAKAIINSYHLDGIDLDYENPQMTEQNAVQFANLVTKLREALPKSIISVTIMSGPQYINSQGEYGFNKETLGDIATQATYVNLMTYDFYGAFSYTPDGSGTTAFLTNLIRPSNAPANYQFSIEQSVEAALSAGVKASQLSVGIPAYGRALTGISSDNGGLFNVIPNTATIPRGDLDAAACSTAIYPLGPNSCSGSFQYKYIVDKMLNHGVTETNRQDQNKVIGTTAYAASWTPGNEGYQLEITNTGSGNDTAFNVSIGDFTAPDFFNVGTDKTYDAQTTTSIAGKKGLTVQWYTSWGPKGQCDKPFDFTKNTHVMIKVTPDNAKGIYVTTCDIKSN